MPTSNDRIDPQGTYESRRRRRTLIAVLGAVAILLLVAALHLVGVLPPGG